jgi:hypothetical protein
MKDKLVNTCINKIINTPVLDFLLVEGGMVILYFGTIISENPFRSSMQLTINSAWRVEVEGKVVVGSLSETDLIMVILNKLIGLTISNISASDYSYDLSILLSDRTKIVTFAYSVEDMLWEFRNESSKLLVDRGFQVRRDRCESEAQDENSQKKVLPTKKGSKKRGRKGVGQ